jgi:carboxylate-amine ligase
VPVDEPVPPSALRILERDGPGRVAADVAAAVEREGVVHGAGADVHPFHVDPVPRVFAAAEWAELEAGLAQRVRALERWVADVYGPREAARAGVVPQGLLDGCPHLEPDVAGLAPPPVRLGISGPDVVRGEDGRLRVLEDNGRTPTLMAYALAARRLVAARVGGDARPRDIAGPLRESLLRVLRAAAGGGDLEGAVILGDGGGQLTSWEVEALGRILDLPVLEPGDLRRRGDRVVRADGGAPVEVVWRRTDEERLRGADGALTALGELFLEPLRAGNVAVVNAFGSGVADDKRTYAHAEDLVRFFCGEEPLLPSVPTWDLGIPERRAEALERLPELVVKPRAGEGGIGVVLGPEASSDELDEARRRIEASPGDWIAQEAVALSAHPTVVDDRLEPRHVDLRPFVFGDGHEAWVLPGGLSRVALEAGDRVVNATQGGGGKDVWVLP